MDLTRFNYPLAESQILFSCWSMIHHFSKCKMEKGCRGLHGIARGTMSSSADYHAQKERWRQNCFSQLWEGSAEFIGDLAGQGLELALTGGSNTTGNHKFSFDKVFGPASQQVSLEHTADLSRLSRTWPKRGFHCLKDSESSCWLVLL